MPIWLPFALGALVIYGTVKAITAVIDKLKSIGTELASIDLGKAAENIMNSLINGIKAKIADVKAVITDVGAAITGAFDSEMKIASPSKVMTQRANWVVDPLVTVPEQRAGEVRQAIGGLGGLDAPQRASGTGGAGGPVNITINVTGRDDGDEVARKVDEKLRAFFLGEARGSAMVPA
jgi:hypothetical protein